MRNVHIGAKNIIDLPPPDASSPLERKVMDIMENFECVNVNIRGFIGEGDLFIEHDSLNGRKIFIWACQLKNHGGDAVIESTPKGWHVKKFT